MKNVKRDDDGKRLTVEGMAEIGAILNGTDGICGSDNSVPFKVDLEASGIPETFEYSCDAVCMGARARIDGGKVYADIELQLNLMVLGSEEKSVLVSATFAENTERNDTSGVALRLFYPAEGENLWSVGKQFGVSRDRIAEANGIVDGQKLPPVIMIPVK